MVEISKMCVGFVMVGNSRTFHGLWSKAAMITNHQASFIWTLWALNLCI